MYNILKISRRIKKHEGFNNAVYKDQLGFKTIGYGHLITQKESFVKNKKYPMTILNKVFHDDLNKAIKSFEKIYKDNNLSENIQEVIIEMIFQLGIKNLLKFKKFNYYIKKKQLYLAALEMMKSRWYLQTPKRVNKLVKILLKQNA